MIYQIYTVQYEGASISSLIFCENFMVTDHVVSEISGGGGSTPPDAIKLSEKADAINR